MRPRYLPYVMLWGLLLIQLITHALTGHQPEASDFYCAALWIALALITELSAIYSAIRARNEERPDER